MDNELVNFVRRALMESQGIELDLDEITDVKMKYDPITGDPVIQAEITMKAPPMRIDITSKYIKVRDR